jgi:hypothetical protein
MQIISLAEQPDLEPKMDELIAGVWPAYILNHSVGANRWWYYMMRHFPDCQLGLFDDTNKMVAVVNCVPVNFEGAPHDLPENGWDGMVEAGMSKHKADVEPNTLLALSVSIARTHKGQGLSYTALKAMKAIGAKYGFSRLYAPVRPSHKSHYPMLPMDDYVKWKRDDGELFDAWLRVHSKLGAAFIKVSPQSMHIETTIENWEKDTGLSFKQSGQYVVPGALCPVEMNLEEDRGTYIEPNVWMHHAIHPGDAKLLAD